MTPIMAPPIHIYNQLAPTTTVSSKIPPIPAFSSSGNQLDLATILQFVGPICAAAMQKLNAQSADILSQSTNALAKPFPHALTDVANHVSSLSPNPLSGIIIVPTTLTPSLPIISTQIHREPVVNSQINTPSTPTQSNSHKTTFQGALQNNRYHVVGYKGT